MSKPLFLHFLGIHKLLSSSHPPTQSQKIVAIIPKILNSLIWGFSPDLITMFKVEFLGIFIQGTYSNTMEPITAPKCLLQINGGHTAVDLVNVLISVLAKHINIKDQQIIEFNPTWKELIMIII